MADATPTSVRFSFDVGYTLQPGETPSVAAQSIADWILRCPYIVDSVTGLGCTSLGTLEETLAALPEGHHERPGLIRAIELIRNYGSEPGT